MKIQCLIVLLFVHACSLNFPQYKQCHNSWKDEKMGNSSDTLCSKGALVSCAAMALSGIGMSYNPSSLNKWLSTHGGYIHGNNFVWASMNTLTMVYEGTISNYLIEKRLNEGYVLFCNVNNGTHWVLAHSHFNDKIHVNDPLYNKTTYALTEIQDGKTAIFRPENPPQVPEILAEDKVSEEQNKSQAFFKAFKRMNKMLRQE